MLNGRVFNLGEFLPPDIPLDLCHMQFEVPPSLVFRLQAGSLRQIRGKFRRIRKSAPARRLVVLDGTNCYSWGCAYFSDRLSSIRSFSP